MGMSRRLLLVIFWYALASSILSTKEMSVLLAGPLKKFNLMAI